VNGDQTEQVCPIEQLQDVCAVRAEEDNWLAATTVVVVEVASSNKRDAQCREESRRHDAQLRARILFANGFYVALSSERQWQPSGILNLT